MLSELYDLALNLQNEGIEIEPSHKDFDTPGLSVNHNLVVRLDSQGSLCGFSALSAADSSALWTLKNGNFDFFPATRVNAPVFEIPTDDPLWKQINAASVLDAVNRFRVVARAVQFSNGIGIRRQAERIRGWSGIDAEEHALQTFASAFLLFAVANESLPLGPKRFVEAAELALTSGDGDLVKIIAAMLFGKRVEQKGKLPSIECKVQLIFDLKTKTNPLFSLYNARTKAMVRRLLLQERRPHDSVKTLHADSICALSLSHRELRSTPLPQWRASKVITKGVPPFSKFSLTPCNFRYDRAGIESFALGHDTAEILVGALQWITGDARLQKTWRPIKNGKLDKGNYEKEDLLIAYPSADAETLALVQIFAPPTNQDSVSRADDEKNFSDTAAVVISALQERVLVGRLADWVKIMLIRSVSDGQIQLVVSASPNIQEFSAAVSLWGQSEYNYPRSLRVPVPSETTRSGLVWIRPKVLFPEEIGRLLTHQWIRAGTESSRIEAPSITLIFELFLRKPGAWEQHAAHLLETAIARAWPLLVGAGNVLHRTSRDDEDRDKWSDWINLFPKSTGGKLTRSKPQPGRSFINTISLIGSLLYAMNSKVENYTNESAFLLGRLLAMMDELHRCYCIVERDGAIPKGALMGNGLLGRAAESPARALEELLDRSRIYVGWAKTVEPSSDPKAERARIAIYSARKVLRLAGPLSNALHQADALDIELPPICKAHLLLGYLSPVLGEAEAAATSDTSAPINNGPSTQEAKSS